MFAQPFVQAQIKESIKAPVTGLCEGYSPVTGEFSAQMASNAENISIWWRHHDSDLTDKQECRQAEQFELYILLVLMMNAIGLLWFS